MSCTRAGNSQHCTMEKVCPRCGARFECLRDSITNCHCAGVPLADAVRRFIGDNYEGCLCNGCLRLVGDTFYSAGINPRYAGIVKSNLYIWSEK